VTVYGAPRAAVAEGLRWAGARRDMPKTKCRLGSYSPWTSTAAGRRGLGQQRARNDSDLMSSSGQRMEHGRVMLGTEYNVVEHGEGLGTLL
jgi:hypothetical protein